MPPLRPPKYVLASVWIALGGLANGLDTGCVGAMINMKQFTDTIGELSASMVGFTVSMIMLTGAVPSIFAGHLAERFGRLKVILGGALIMIFGILLQATSYSLEQFLLGRAVTGAGQGIYLSVCSVYICEIAPAAVRGILGGLPQFMATAGICIGYFICYGTVAIESSMAWRVGYVVQAVNAVAFLASCFFLPESPRWLILHGKKAEGIKALQRLEFSMVEAERDFLSAETQQSGSLSIWQSFLILFKRGYRSRTILALFILGMVQLSGIDGVVYYAPILFSRAGLSSDTASFLASGVSAILMLAISIPAFLFADKWGRRTSAITGGIGLTGCMLLIGSLYAAGVVGAEGFARWVVIVSVFVFGLTYCATWGIVGKIYASEIQPSNTRAAANCVAMGLCFFTNWLVAILTPILLDKSAYAAYFLFGGLAMGTTAVLATYMPETRGRSLENIQEAFQRPGIKSISHYLRPLTSARQRRGMQEPSADTGDEGIELTAHPMASGTSVEAVARGMRVDVTSA